MVNVFISYASEDIQLVNELSSFLDDNGFDVWLDKKNILAGENWRESIQRGLEKADFIVVCISRNSVNKRGFVQREMKYALDMLDEFLDDDIYLIPLVLDNSPIPRRLSKVQSTDFLSKTGREKLVSSLRIGAKRRGIECKITEFDDVDKEEKKNVDLSGLGGGKLAGMLGFLK